MKKLLSLSVASLALVAAAEYTASPLIGVTEITTTNKNTIVAVPFNSLAGAGNISVTDLVCTNGLENNTWIYVHTGSAYSAWKLTAEGWQAAISATPDQIIGASAAEANQTVNYGTSFWIVLPAWGC